jgi:hypothetical protein
MAGINSLLLDIRGEGRRGREARERQKYIFLWAGGVAQVVECLHSKSETLTSNPSTAKKKENTFL